MKLGRLSYRLSRWRKVREEVNVCSAGRGIGEEQREEKGDTPGEEGAVSFEGHEDGLVVEERKEKFSSNILAGGICEDAEPQGLWLMAGANECRRCSMDDTTNPLL